MASNSNRTGAAGDDAFGPKAKGFQQQQKKKDTTKQRKKPEAAPDCSVSEVAVSRLIRDGHGFVLVLTMVCMIFSPKWITGILHRKWQLTVGYFLFEAVHLFVCKLCVKDLIRFPANYMALMLVRCLLFFNNEYKLTVASFFPEPPSTFSPSPMSDGIGLAVVVFLVVPTLVIISLKVVYIGDRKLFCLVGSSLSSLLAVIILLTSPSLDADSTKVTEYTINGKVLQSYGHYLHFRLCQLWIYITIFMTLVNLLSIGQRLYKRTKKQIPTSQLDHYMDEFFIMILSYGLTIPYLRLVYPNMSFLDYFTVLPKTNFAISSLLLFLEQVSVTTNYLNLVWNETARPTLSWVEVMNYYKE